ncbi:metal-sensitive transcriptional regulator [uncultured Meiothermus sp.]|jgi:DNA-binding FrmR family transcriptional regulator|uniref:metal-sensitive transcriptional regulator n=1 Tax=uncultured Meiothermus sp. TaxID=157471 RepID=UPI00263017D7|nr:metal-sensitive transcriptional regulator [uncultured Meiothermus sp.]
MPQGPREQILSRLATTQGHLAAIQRMVGREAAPLETLRQVRAVRSALLGVEELLVRQALSRCLAERPRAPQELLEEVGAVLNLRESARARALGGGE